MCEIITGFDGAVAHFFASLPPDGALLFIMRAFSLALDNGALPLVLAAVLLIPKKTRFSGICILGSLLICLLICNVTLKPLVQRPRPFEIYGFSPLVATHGDFSFPSGHTAAAFSCAFVVFMSLSRRWGAFALGFALMVGISRLYLRVHFLTDVVSGALIGVMCAILAVCATQALRRFYTHRRLLP